MKNKTLWKTVLTVAKYAITVALGYLAGDGSVINTLTTI